MLIQTQLSNYDSNGKFILECDSGWQMMMGRIRELLKLLPDLEIHIMGPLYTQLKTLPFDLNRDLFKKYYDRLQYIPHKILPNALATRYDFNFDDLGKILQLGNDKNSPYTHVFINDPMQLRNYQALFYLKAKYRPMFVVHSHFIDNPECPKFPTEASLWFGQLEAAYKADYNFWQCESSMKLFLNSAKKWITKDMITKIECLSSPWDDGYSSAEINSDINYDNVRFDIQKVKQDLKNKIVLFVPNRIGGKGRSSDYTNCGKFMFEVIPEIFKYRQDLVVLAGNPSQKITNNELKSWCPAYYNLVPDALNRDEYKVVAHQLQQISVGLYNQDSYGGTSARELCDAGTIPLWVNNYEYTAIAECCGWDGKEIMIKSDLSDINEKTLELIDWYAKTQYIDNWKQNFRQVVRNRCSYEATTPKAIKLMDLEK